MTDIGTAQSAEVVVVGSANLDVTVAVERWPGQGETVLGAAPKRGVGGKGLNQAVASARLGRRTALVGAVGRDDAATTVRAALEAEMVDDHLVTVDEPTGLAQVFVGPDADSTIVVSPGANHALTPALVQARAELLRSARAVLCQLEIPLEAVDTALALSAGLRTLNPAPGAELPDAVLAATDVLVPNRFELARLTGSHHDLDRNALVAAIHAALRRMREGGLVVVTLGHQGALAAATHHVELVPAAALPVGAEVVDATAAGDTFCAALVDALLDDATPPEAARWAAAAAAVTVTRAGAAAATPSRDEVRRVAAG